MGEKSSASVELRSFPGMTTDVDPNDVAPGAAELQLNITSDEPGKLIARRGIREVSFDPEDQA